MAGQPLRRSARLAAKSSKVHAPKCTPGILRVSKAASPGASKSPTRVKFGRNAVAEFEKSDSPNELEALSDEEAEQLFPHNIVSESAFDDDQTKRNEGILAKWDELFEDWDYSDDSSTDSDDSTGGSEHSSGYVVFEEKEIDCFAIAGPGANVCQPRGETNKMPTTRVDIYFCDFCKRGVRRATKYFYD